jgi:hypothetical protein
MRDGPVPRTKRVDVLAKIAAGRKATAVPATSDLSEPASSPETIRSVGRDDGFVWALAVSK